MHDVAKPTTIDTRTSKRFRIRTVFYAVIFIAAVFGLIRSGAATMVLVITIVTALILWFGFLAYRLFRSGRNTSGAILTIVGIFLLLIDMKALQFQKMGAMGKMMGPPPMTVTSAVVKEEDWVPILSSVGSISAVQGAIVSTELGGVVGKIAFENGSTAKKGDMLIQLDASAEEAQLHSAEADLNLARADLERSRDLAVRKVISKADQDAAESKFNRLNAVVDQMRSNIRKKTIVAPFDGQLGIRQVNVGQMINSGQQVVQLTALDRVYVDFALPQQELSKLSPGLEVHVRTDAVPGREFIGKLTAINSMVDTVTRNITLQGTLENPDRVLRPGMFAKIELLLPEKHKAVVIPGSAVSYAPFGDSVFVIEKKKDPKTGKESESIRQQFVRVGEARGDLVAIVEGLKPNETVVSTGVFKLRNGMAVTVNNELAPNPEASPHPADS